nr:MAG TPA: hypothetical protein [Caudoviricetes sp.]
MRYNPSSVISTYAIIVFLVDAQVGLLVKLASTDFANLPFTEGVIADGRRLEAKINQSKRAWCKSHALNIFI